VPIDISQRDSDGAGLKAQLLTCRRIKPDGLTRVMLVRVKSPPEDDAALPASRYDADVDDRVRRPTSLVIVRPI
jgi:hypothetical protein